MMKVIIAGSRDIYDYDLVKEAIVASGFEITEVVSGRARGVDSLGERWAHENGVPLQTFPADWEKFGKAAGPIRNGEMAEYSEALIAVMWSEGSKGTANMVKQAEAKGLRTFVIKVEKKDEEQAHKI